MDRARIDRSRNQTCGNYNNTAEPEYDVVDDQEEILNVRILPARPINEEREYAVSFPLKTGIFHGRYQLRAFPHSPLVTPTSSLDVHPEKSHIELTRSISSTSSPGAGESLAWIESGQALQERAEFRSHATGLQRAESVLAPNNTQRRSLDLETQMEIRSQKNLERVPSKRHHHEWPQMKEDIDQHDFVPKEKPQQTYCEEDWYVGACNRADAEHALHLVNKDGAFLVRDCSNTTNSEPLVLAVYHEKKVYNVKIRFIESTSKYALGTGQRSKDMFDTVGDIIKFHTIFPIILVSGRNIPGSKYPENCVLTCPVTRRDVDLLLQ
ncbi:hypothetical protein INR49_013524 [Caranx melampygus]|nr:hypothetical protein INR49_013524 [Caranx melampygus]